MAVSEYQDQSIEDGARPSEYFISTRTIRSFLEEKAFRPLNVSQYSAADRDDEPHTLGAFMESTSVYVQNMSRYRVYKLCDDIY